MLMPVGPKAGLRSHPSNWTKEPEKAETHCFYCRQAVPNHSAECTVPQRTVVVEMTIQYVISVPANWDKDTIEFHRNDSSFCSSNDIKQIHEESTRFPNMCTTCRRVDVTYLREATEKDHEDLYFQPKNED